MEEIQMKIMKILEIEVEDNEKWNNENLANCFSTDEISNIQF